MKKALLFFAAALLFASCTTGEGTPADPPADTRSETPADRSADHEGPVYSITEELFQNPYIDIDEWRDAPVRHRYIHGGFEGTAARFSFYLPEKGEWKGRFFQYITPVPDSENLSQGASGAEDRISFAIESGAYFVETNGGGVIDLHDLGLGLDQSYGAYRANAAAAEFSRMVASDMYGGGRIYGYAYGGSGGAYRTVGGFENTTVWDGAVPYVIGSPMSIPNVFSVRMHLMRVLKDRLPDIADALDAGGSGDVYGGLTEEEADALTEAAAMGFPLQSLYNYETMGVHAMEALYPGILAADPSYFTDFWTLPGYLGADDPESFEADRIRQTSRVARLLYTEEAVSLGLIGGDSDSERGTADLAWKKLSDMGSGFPVGFVLEDELKEVQFLGGDLHIRSGEAEGKMLQLKAAHGTIVLLGPARPDVLAAVQPGDEVMVDNSGFLALQTYHRHQVPGPAYKVWDQFRNGDGTPAYPQRPMVLGPIFTMSATGDLPSGIFEGKMILLSSLWDQEAFPWQADFYRSQVEAHLEDKTDDSFRLWFTDRAVHRDMPVQESPTHVVSYLGAVQQALRDLSLWVEQGVEPPVSTAYRVEDGQVVVPLSAEERKGIQPVVELTASGDKRVEVEAGDTVVFRASAELPSGTGSVVEGAWDFDGSGRFDTAAELVTDGSGQRVSAEGEYRFDKPGTHFVTFRAAAQREGDVDTPFARIYNLDRVRVVVY